VFTKTVLYGAGAERLSPVSWDELLGPEEIRAWLVRLREERKLAPASLGPTISALRFLYRVRLKRPWSDEDFPLPKRPFRLPVVLSLEEITTFFESIASVKQRTILMTAYAAGLRVSEAVHLKVTDVDSQRMVIRVNQGKNRKDRYVMLSPRLLEILRMARRSSQGVAISGRHPRAPYHPVRSSAGLPDRAPAQRHHEAHHAPFAAARLRHASAGKRHRRAQDPAADGSSQPFDDGQVPEIGNQHHLCNLQPI
jgi:integrase/recombinase XerD